MRFCRISTDILFHKVKAEYLCKEVTPGIAVHMTMHCNFDSFSYSSNQKTQTRSLSDISYLHYYNRILKMNSKIKSFDGTGNVKVFLEKVSIHSSLKGYEDEECSQNIASRLEGRAFDVYMRLGNEDKKNPDKVKEELLKEFERGKQDRELAIHELNNRMRNTDESVQTFAYKIQELVTWPTKHLTSIHAILLPRIIL